MKSKQLHAQLFQVNICYSLEPNLDAFEAI